MSSNLDHWFCASPSSIEMTTPNFQGWTQHDRALWHWVKVEQYELPDRWVIVPWTHQPVQHELQLLWLQCRREWPVADLCLQTDQHQTSHRRHAGHRQTWAQPTGLWEDVEYYCGAQKLLQRLHFTGYLLPARELHGRTDIHLIRLQSIPERGVDSRHTIQKCIQK